MAKIKYNTKLWVDTATNLAKDTTVFEENDFIYATDSGVLKKGDGEKAYKDLGSIGTVAAWKDIAGKPETFEPSEHDHAIEAEETTNLEAAETLQDLAEALSARIAELDGRVSLLEVAEEGGEVE